MPSEHRGVSESGSSEQSAESLELSASSLLFGSCGWHILIFFGASLRVSSFGSAPLCFLHLNVQSANRIGSDRIESNRIESNRSIVSASGSKRPSAPTVDLDNV